MRVYLFVYLALIGGLGMGSAFPASPVWVVGSSLGDLTSAFSELGLEAHLVPGLSEVPLDATSVLVMAEDYPDPTRLGAADIDQLRAITARGGRALIEFARPAERTSLFGVETESEPRRALSERLVVLQPLGGLQPEALLDDHASAYVPFTSLPEGAERLLEYDLCLGTYDRRPLPEQGRYSVTVDLGEIKPLVTIAQRFGAGRESYAPESVELWLSTDGVSYERVARQEGPGLFPEARFELEGRSARSVRLVARKLKRDAVSDFFFAGEVTVLDTSGKNIALARPYVLEPADAVSGAYPDDGTKLTDGVVDGPYTDKQSVGWGTPEPPKPTNFPALVRVPVGRGEVLLVGPKLSDWKQRHFRLTERFEALWRGLLLELLPEEERLQALASYVPLKAWTEPRRWAVPGTEVKLIVETSPQAAVTCEGLALKPVEGSPGHFEATFTSTEGERRFDVRARTATGEAQAKVDFSCSLREVAYRQALDRVMGWYEASGVLDSPLAKGGVASQTCLAWFDSGQQDKFPNRVDCQAMSAEAFFLYDRLEGGPAWRERAIKLLDLVEGSQIKDPARASFGGFPWLLENDDTLWFWDDNCRSGMALLWGYHWTGDERYLSAAMRSGELFRQVAREDGCVHRHCISAKELDQIGREAYRAFSQGTDADYRLQHWGSLAAVTGDAEYIRLWQLVERLWTPQVWLRGAAHAAHYLDSDAAKQRTVALADQLLADPAVARWGAVLAPGGDYKWAFVNDCGIATDSGEPLTDQLYATPWYFLEAWRAWKATGDERCRQLAEGFGDYLVRIQCDLADPRLAGCWMRGFDVEHWEYFGAPYDPNYGPYSAYTGWMNSIAAQALAWYLLDEPPFLPESGTDLTRKLVADLRAFNPKLVEDGPNLALGAAYSLSPEPLPAYADAGGELTDGILDGTYSDGLSVAWHMEEGERLQTELRLDLGELKQLKLVTQQYGAGTGAYNPDEVVLLTSRDGEQYEEAHRQSFAETGPGLLWAWFEAPLEARYLTFQYTKHRRSPVTDFLFIGETKAFSPLDSP